MRGLIDELRYRLTLAVLTIAGILTVASLSAHYCVEVAHEKLQNKRSKNQ